MWIRALLIHVMCHVDTCYVLREYMLRVMYYVYVLRGYELHITQYVILSTPFVVIPIRLPPARCV